MNTLTAHPGRCLVIGLVLLGMSGISEARPDHQSRNKHSKQDRGHHASTRHYYPAPRHLSRLPAGYLGLSYAGANYYFHGGTYYQRRGFDYALIRPPLGISINFLPSGYRTHYHGRQPYYSAHGVFYRRDDWRRNYVVIDDPVGIYTGTTPAGSITEQYIYPRQGQDPNQAAQDRYECYLWAAGQTGVEPAQVNISTGAGQLQEYQRANGACLEARGYSVK